MPFVALSFLSIDFRSVTSFGGALSNLIEKKDEADVRNSIEGGSSFKNCDQF